MIESIYEAVEILGIGENATLVEINQKYKSLLFKWHPDHCKDNADKCKAMTEKIIEAYRIVTNYCYNYKFSFKKEELENIKKIDPEEFWHRKFGHDPLWGYPK